MYYKYKELMNCAESLERTILAQLELARKYFKTKDPGLRPLIIESRLNVSKNRRLLGEQFKGSKYECVQLESGTLYIYIQSNIVRRFEAKDILKRRSR